MHENGVPAFAIVGLARPRVRRGAHTRSQRHRLGRARVPARAGHRQPRTRRAAEGRLRLRPADRARGARRLAADPADGAEPARGGRRARARRAAAPRRRRARGRRGRAPPRDRAARSARPSRRRRRRSPACEPIPVAPPGRGGRVPARRARARAGAGARRRPEAPPLPDLAEVRGQERARRALEIAAAGRQNLLLAGPPGTGKTMLARRLPGILPPLDAAAALEVTRIHSVAGLLPPEQPLVRTPPFRAPHHSASTAAIVGGGPGIRPGRGEPRAPGRPAARRARGVPAPGARGAASAARGRRRLRSRAPPAARSFPRAFSSWRR